VLLKKRYEAEPDVERLMELTGQEKVLLRHIRIRLHSVQATDKERVAVERKTADEVARLRNQESILRSREVEEVSQLYAGRDRRLQELATKRAKLDLEEAQELACVCKPVQARLQALDQKRTALQTAEANELATALKNLQAQHLLNYLRGSSIERASVPGIGPKLKQRLMAAGFRNAADVEYYRVLRVERIGPQLASGLVAWRQEIERAAAAFTPRALPQGVESTIKGKYAAQVHGITPIRRARTISFARTRRRFGRGTLALALIFHGRRRR
jgi:DNA-binding helix-hairpin-helix protein with protein kinase domain